MKYSLIEKIFIHKMTYRYERNQKMKKCWLRAIMSVLVMCMLLAGAGSIKTEAMNLGTAQFIGGKTILVSIFTNTSKYSWIG